MPHIDLLELPYFQGISIDHLVQLVDLMRPAQYREGELLMSEGEPQPQPLFIATVGRVLITKRNRDQKERRLAELDAPTLFGEIELFCQIPAVCSARAMTSVSAFLLDRPTFEKLFAEQNPAALAFTFNVAKVACHRLAIADEMFSEVLADEDLCTLRRQVWARMSGGQQWLHTTGAFRLPK